VCKRRRTSQGRKCHDAIAVPSWTAIAIHGTWKKSYDHSRLKFGNHFGRATPGELDFASVENWAKKVRARPVRSAGCTGMQSGHEEGIWVKDMAPKEDYKTIKPAVSAGKALRLLRRQPRSAHASTSGFCNSQRKDAEEPDGINFSGAGHDYTDGRSLFILKTRRRRCCLAQRNCQGFTGAESQ